MYESHSLEHLSEAAKERLAEIHSTMTIDYEGAEAILVAEGLYSDTTKGE
jgi:hypothetical protein